MLVNLQFSDGCLDVILIKECPKLDLLSILTEVSKGNHVKSPHVLYFKVSWLYCAKDLFFLLIYFAKKLFSILSLTNMLFMFLHFLLMFEGVNGRKIESLR